MLVRKLLGPLGCAVILIPSIVMAGCTGKARSAVSSSSGAAPAASSGKRSSDHVKRSSSDGSNRTATDDSRRSASSGSMENSILYYVNLHRRRIGLAPLRMNGVESSVAAQHSRNIASGRTPFGHQGLDNRFDYISNRVPSVTNIGENVAYGQMSAKEVVDAWLSSSGHRRNIEGNFTMTGIGLARGRKGGLYYTQIFTR